jgi:hypothetical protein
MNAKIDEGLLKGNGVEIEGPSPIWKVTALRQGTLSLDKHAKVLPQVQVGMEKQAPEQKCVVRSGRGTKGEVRPVLEPKTHVPAKTGPYRTLFVEREVLDLIPGISPLRFRDVFQHRPIFPVAEKLPLRTIYLFDSRLIQFWRWRLGLGKASEGNDSQTRNEKESQ